MFFGPQAKFKVWFYEGENEGAGGAVVEAPAADAAEPEAPAADAVADSKGRKEPTLALPKKDWREVRLGEVSAKNRQLERQLQERETELAQWRQSQQAAQQTQQATQPAVAPAVNDEELNLRAEALAAAREFDSACNRVVAEGKGANADFEAKLAGFRDIGGLPPSVVEAALELEADDPDFKASALLYNLAGDLNEAMRIFRLSPSRQGAALAKLAKSAPKPQTSNAPEPPGRGLARGTANAVQKDPDQMSYAEWEKWREANRKPRR